jgi:hypothetical protein
VVTVTGIFLIVEIHDSDLQTRTYVCMYVQGRDSDSLLRSVTATPTKPIYGPISDSPEQSLLYGIVSLLIPLEPLRSQTEFE